MKNDAVNSGEQNGLVIGSGLKASPAKLFTIFASLSLNMMVFLGGDREIFLGNVKSFLPGDVGDLAEFSIAETPKNSFSLKFQLHQLLNLGNLGGNLGEQPAQAVDLSQVKAWELPGNSGTASGVDEAFSNRQTFTFGLPLASPIEITSPYGWRTHPILGGLDFHPGVDFAAAEGSPVLAANSGQVAIADWSGGYGLMVVLAHDSATSETLYAHLSKIFVEPGEMVAKGQVIGLVGSTGASTGPHLHFEYRELTSEGWVAVNPSSWLDHQMTVGNFAQTPAQTPGGEATVLVASSVPNSAPNSAGKLSSELGSELGGELGSELGSDRPIELAAKSKVNLAADTSATSLPSTPEFNRWVTELKQEFTNLKTKTLNSASDYPATACAAKLEGAVVVGVFANAWGQIIRQPKLLQASPDQALNQAALNYIQDFNLPETGQPTAYQYVFQFQYDQKTCQ